MFTGSARVRGGLASLWPADRRGAVALVFAVAATVLFGFVALATEGGTWYLVRRNAQNAADAAAYAGALTLLTTASNSQIQAAGVDLATRNGFTAGGSTTVAVNHPPTTGARAGNTATVEVVINQTQPVFLSSLFLATAPVVTTRAVAMLQTGSVACLLALNGAVNIHDSSSYSSPGCAIASNSTMSGAVNLPQSNASVTASGVITSGTCTGCAGSYVHLSKGYQQNVAPVTNPYANLDTKAAPPISSCYNTAQLNVSGPLVPYTTSLTKAYCGNVTVSNTGDVTFPSGTYVFRNASLTIGSIASFTCLNCTFLFIGSNPGSLSITNMSTVRATAAATNSIDSDYNGLLFYRANSGTTGSAGSPTLNFQSVSSFDLAGGIYYPGAYVRVGNVSTSSNYNCLPIVGGTIEIGNLNSFGFSTANCSTYNTKLPTQQTARLVE